MFCITTMSKEMHPKDKQDHSAISLPPLITLAGPVGLCFIHLGQIKPSYHKGEKQKLPVDLLMVTEQTEPLHELLPLPYLPCVLQFHP